MVYRLNIIVPGFAGISEESIEQITMNCVSFNAAERPERCNAVSLLYKKIHGIDDSELLENIDEANDSDGVLFGLYLQAEGQFQLNVGDEVTVR